MQAFRAPIELLKSRDACRELGCPCAGRGRSLTQVTLVLSQVVDGRLNRILADGGRIIEVQESEAGRTDSKQSGHDLHTRSGSPYDTQGNRYHSSFCFGPWVVKEHNARRGGGSPAHSLLTEIRYLSHTRCNGVWPELQGPPGPSFGAHIEGGGIAK